MILCLNVQNVALIEKLNIEWQPNMTVLTGETGAGKSILIDCVNLLLGARSDKTLVRFGTAKARIQGMFSASREVIKYLAENGIDSDEDSILIDRELMAEGRSVCRINGMMVTQNILREVGTMLINIHGQHDNQALLTPEKHMDFLDKYADTDLVRYKELYDERKRLLGEMAKFNKDRAEREQRIDMLKFQINELEAANLQENEEDELKEKRLIIENAEKIAVSLNEAYGCLYGERCAYDMLASAVSALEKVSGIDDGLDETLSKIVDAKYTIEDCVHEISSFSESVDFDENALNEVEERLDTITKLERKYGSSIDKCLKFLEEAKKELDNIENFEERTAELSKKTEEIEAELTKEAEEINNHRTKFAKKLQQEIELALSELDMPKTKFKVELTETADFEPNGRETAEFLICPNVGEELKPLVKIASGGELSRVMLAIKSIIADDVDTLIFDEIDTGVSGSAAQKIARKLSKLSKTKQVICVSHLPQLAAIADNHMLIKKTAYEDKTVTDVKALSAEERVLEIARIIDGTNITETAIKHAKEMLEQ